MTEEKWVTFMFDGNQANGLVASVEDWETKVVAVYRKQVADPERPLAAKRGPDLPGGTPFFGFVVECNGPTLKEWAAEQGMSLPTK